MSAVQKNEAGDFVVTATGQTLAQLAGTSVDRAVFMTKFRQALATKKANEKAVRDAMAAESLYRVGRNF